MRCSVSVCIAGVTPRCTVRNRSVSLFFAAAPTTTSSACGFSGSSAPISLVHPAFPGFSVDLCARSRWRRRPGHTPTCWVGRRGEYKIMRCDRCNARRKAVDKLCRTVHVLCTISTRDPTTFPRAIAAFPTTRYCGLTFGAEEREWTASWRSIKAPPARARWCSIRAARARQRTTGIRSDIPARRLGGARPGSAMGHNARLRRAAHLLTPGLRRAISPASASRISAKRPLIWDVETGVPVYNAIVWQDRRTAARCDSIRADGMAEKIASGHRSRDRSVFFEHEGRVAARQRSRVSARAPPAANCVSARSTVF